MLKDHRGLPLSGSKQDAVDLFEKALTELHSYTGDPIASIDDAIDRDDGLVIAHLFKALAIFTTSEQRFLPAVEASLRNAAALAPQATTRERRLILATERLVAGDWSTASQVFDEVLIDHPQDALAIQIAHLIDFFRGDSLNLRNRISRVLPNWSATMPGYSYVLGMHAFGLEECNQYVEAEKQGRAALELCSRDPWAVHAVTHVMEMQGRIEEGIAWLTERELDWAPNSSLAPHNWWHLALFHLDRGDIPSVLRLLDQHVIGADTQMVLVLVDATAMLWRLTLQGVDVRDRFETIADIWQSKLDVEKGFYAFNDVHAMMAFAATERGGAIESLMSNMRETAVRASGDNAEVTRSVGLPLAEGFLDFAAGNYSRAIARIERVRDHANRFGGSHAQRDVLTLTIIEAALRSNDFRRAHHYIAERHMHKPSNWSRRLLSRTPNMGQMACAA